MTDQPTLYPLGGSLYASVKTWRRSVKIHIRHHTAPTNTKGGRVVPTQRGVTLDLKAFQRLLKVKNKLCQEYNQQESNLSSVQATVPRSAVKAEKDTPSSETRPCLQQEQQPLSMPVLTLASTQQRNNTGPCFYNPHQDSFFQSS